VKKLSNGKYAMGFFQVNRLLATVVQNGIQKYEFEYQKLTFFMAFKWS